MKKILIVIGLALGLGVGFGYYFFHDLDRGIKKVLSTEDVAYAFQVGVYSDYENATLKAKEYTSARVISDEKLYRVYIALVKDEELVNKYKEYFTNLGIDYYVKRINVNGDFLTKLNKYEELLLRSNSKVYDVMNKEILEMYSEVVV